MQQPGPPAGWYPDPATGMSRWWDGTQWRGFATPPPPSPAPPPYPGQFTGGAGQQPGTSWPPQPQAQPGIPPLPPTSPYGAAPYAPYSPQQYGAAESDRSIAILVHISMLFFGFIGPLVVYLIYKDKDAYVRHHAAEALNFSITIFIAFFVSFILTAVLIGLFMILAVAVLAFVMPIVAAVAASKGSYYRYPMTIRLVSGGVGS